MSTHRINAGVFSPSQWRAVSGTGMGQEQAGKGACLLQFSKCNLSRWLLSLAQKVSKAVETVITLCFHENVSEAKIPPPSLFPLFSPSLPSLPLYILRCTMTSVPLSNLLCTSRCPEIISMQTPSEGKLKVIQLFSASTVSCKEFLSLNAHWQLIFFCHFSNLLI